ncbi:MAG: hypothetical protein CYG59_19575, partial [Chloroflexi bacterium]
MLYNWGQPDRVDSILDTCIDQLAYEEPEKVLRRHPQVAPKLAPMLHVAAALREMSTLRLSPAANQRNRERLRQAVLARRRRRAAVFGPRMMRAATWAALLLLVIGVGLSSVTVAAASALPNDRLYAWKRSSENIWLQLQPTPERRANVSLSLAERRVAETQLLYERSGQVDAQVVAQLAQEYARTLSYIAAAPSGEAQSLLQKLRATSAQHEQQLTALARVASGQAQQELLAAAAASEWAQEASPFAGTTPPGRSGDGPNGNSGLGTSPTAAASGAPVAQPAASASATPNAQVGNPAAPAQQSTPGASNRSQPAMPNPQQPSVPVNPQQPAVPASSQPTVPVNPQPGTSSQPQPAVP